MGVADAMHLRRLALLVVPLACTPAADGTPDPAVTTSGSTTTGTTDDAATTTGTTGMSSTTSTASTTDTPTTTQPDPGTTTSTSTTDATTTTGEPIVEELPPIDSVDALETWLAGAAYRAWAVESAVHPSTGPHAGNVLTYVNAIALQSLADGAAEHPIDAATVKELYGDSFDEILGYAVSRKTAALSDGGATWWWYERVNATTYGGELGTTLCTGCHGGGMDYILTPFPLQ